MKDKTVIPDNIARLMSKADRKAMGVTTMDETLKRGEEMVERELQRLCEQWLMRHGIAYLHLSHRARECAGWPDLTFVYNDNGRSSPVAFAIELKTPKGIVSDDQERTLAQMERNGWRTYVIRNYEDFVHTVASGV